MEIDRAQLDGVLYGASCGEVLQEVSLERAVRVFGEERGVLGFVRYGVREELL